MIVTPQTWQTPARFRFPLCVFDTETTGLADDPDARIVELGAVVVDVDGRELATWSSLVRPDRWGDEAAVDEALAVSGITRREIERAPYVRTVEPQLLGWWVGQGKPELTAWRRWFDELLLVRSMPSVASLVSDRWAPCVWEVARDQLGAFRMEDHHRLEAADDLRAPTLRSTAEWLGLEVDAGGRHRALYDARLAARVACALHWRRR